MVLLLVCLLKNPYENLVCKKLNNLHFSLHNFLLLHGYIGNPHFAKWLNVNVVLFFI